MSQTIVLGLIAVLDDGDGVLVVETVFIAEHPGEEVHKDAILLGKLGADRRIGGDLLQLHEVVHGLEEGGDGH